MAENTIQVAPQSTATPQSAAIVKATGDAEALRIRAKGDVDNERLRIQVVAGALGALGMSLIACAIWAGSSFDQYARIVVPILTMAIGALLTGRIHK